MILVFCIVDYIATSLAIFQRSVHVTATPSKTTTDPTTTSITTTTISSSTMIL